MPTTTRSSKNIFSKLWNVIVSIWQELNAPPRKNKWSDDYYGDNCGTGF